MSEPDAPQAATLRRRPMTGRLAEAIAVLVIIALTFVKLAFVSGGTWKAVFLANGDSLVLPLLLKSLHSGEPFDWVFSSQTFFFPEFPLYALCGLIMGTPQAALALNAILNVVLLYLGFRAIAGAVLPGRRPAQLLVALSAATLVMLAVISETDVTVLGAGTIDPNRIPTVLLLTTYYTGAILVALGMLALAVWASNRLGGGPVILRRAVVYGAVAVIGSAAVTYSDPLYLLWFVAPLGLAIFVLLVARRLTLRWALIVIAPQVVGLGLGMLARSVFSRFIAAGYDHYIASYGSAQALGLLKSVAGQWLGSPGGIIRLLVVIVPLAIALVALVRHVARRAPLANYAVFFALFVLFSTGTLIAGQIITGQSTTRYLTVLFVFPLLGLFLLPLDRVEARLRATTQRLRRAIAGSLVVASLVAIGVCAPAVASFAAPRSPVDSACLDRWVEQQPNEGRDLNGVGSFWAVRALALYGTQPGRLLQIVDEPIAVHAWMNNLAPYRQTKFGYVIADEVITGHDLRKALGAPAATVPCSGFTIYDYRGTSGERKLNTSIRTTLGIIQRLRN